MSPFDEILRINARKHMVEFELEAFKISHPSLYKTIIESMKQVKNHS